MANLPALMREKWSGGGAVCGTSKVSAPATSLALAERARSEHALDRSEGASPMREEWAPGRETGRR
jgi:hypothetical protein